jgi:hypothetical protein
MDEFLSLNEKTTAGWYVWKVKRELKGRPVCLKGSKEGMKGKPTTR